MPKGCQLCDSRFRVDRAIRDIYSSTIIRATISQRVYLGAICTGDIYNFLLRNAIVIEPTFDDLKTL